MNILDLDEAQGLTPQMVREWLANLDPAIMPSACISDDIIAVSGLCGETPQALLREINPRMRKGMPSEAARKACASWLVRDAETGEVELHRTEGTSLYSASDYKSGTLKTEAVPLRDFGDWMEFWPCDANGNKLRWPTDANGAML